MRLILHIGGAKCGSSAIQHVLAENAEHLCAQGVLIPGEQLDLESHVKGQQIRFFLESVGRADGPGLVASRLRALHESMVERGLHTVVVSAENLINPNRYPELFAGVENIFDVQIVAYVRRQDDYLISAWQQWALKVYPSLDAFLEARVGKDANWAHLLAPWGARFGKSRILVRRFHRTHLRGGDVVDDFFFSLGLPLDGIARSNGLYNRSWSEHAGELAHRVSDMFADQHDNKFFRDLLHAIGPAVYKSYSGSLLLTLEKRREILAAYAECNAALRADYFPNLPPEDPIFAPPVEADVVTIGELDRLRGQQDLLVRAIVGLSERVRNLENSNAALERALRPTQHR